MLQSKLKKSKRQEIDETLREMEKVSERIIHILESNGITEQDLMDNLAEARKRVFEKHYPALAAELKKKKSR